jgi:histidinol-phosphate aminotransferase
MGQLKAKPHLAAVRPAAHGGPDYDELARLGIDPRDVLDFSVNTNPAPIPDGLRQAIACAQVTTYPDGNSGALRQAAAEAYSVGADQVLAGNGSSELIWLAAQAYIGPGDTALVRQPAFGEYEVAARIQGAEMARYSTDLAGALQEHRPSAAFVCNPNNPTGDQLDPGRLLELACEHPATLFVIDEAYADFVAGRPTAISRAMPENVLVLRSLTKFSALAGLRLGLAFGAGAVIDALRTVKPPWNVNAAAQAAGEYALRHPQLLPDLDWLAAARRRLVEGLRGLGLRPLPTDCNFFLVPVGDARGLRSRLLAQGCLVRDCASFGLPDHIRVAVRGDGDNARLLAAMAAVL